MTQLSLDDALRQRDEALERVAAKAGAEWSARATVAVLTCAFDRGTFIADDVWPFLGADTPPNPKALGPVLMMLARQKRIVATGELRPHPKRHATKTMVWRLA